jgi:hypothetical protein
MSDDDVGRKLDQLLCKSSDAVEVTASPAVIDLEIAALAPTELLETLPKCRNARTHGTGRSRRASLRCQSAASARPAAHARRVATLSLRLQARK